MAKSTARHYVNNKDFYEALVNYRNARLEAERTNDPPPKIPDYIGECIYKIAYKLASKGNFCNYTYKDEMISDGIENCINYLNSFNPDRTNNPFAYFTRVLWNAYVLRIHKEKKQTYIKYKALEEAALFGDFDTGSHSNTEMDINDNMKAFVRDYEKKLTEKKQKTANLEVIFETGESNEAG